MAVVRNGKSFQNHCDPLAWVSVENSAKFFCKTFARVTNPRKPSPLGIYDLSKVSNTDAEEHYHSHSTHEFVSIGFKVRESYRRRLGFGCLLRPLSSWSSSLLISILAPGDRTGGSVSAGRSPRITATKWVICRVMSPSSLNWKSVGAEESSLSRTPVNN